MVSDLRPETIVFDRRTGRYRSPFGGFLSQSDIRVIVQEQHKKLRTKLERISKQFLSEKRAIADLEETVSKTIKNSIQQMAMLGAGGKQALLNSKDSPVYIRQTKELLDIIFSNIRRLGDQIEKGELTTNQIIDRIRRQGRLIFSAYNQAELLQRISDRGHNEGRRTLAIGVKHCPDCPAYSTGGKYVAIEELIPVGIACICGGYCYCTIETRFNPQKALNELRPGRLVDRVLLNAENQYNQINQFKARYGIEDL